MKKTKVPVEASPTEDIGGVELSPTSEGSIAGRTRSRGGESQAKLDEKDRTDSDGGKGGSPPDLSRSRSLD